jgi:hypothetical protein
MSDNGVSRRSASYADETSTAFNHDFSRLVLPGLLNLVVVNAYLVQTGVCSFSEAANSVVRVALRLGAERLSDSAFDDLVEWVDLEILARIDDPPTPGVLPPDQVAALMQWEV